nr:hypothetical protein BaRGS_013297 [Batillaria attramentaria]
MTRLFSIFLFALATHPALGGLPDNQPATVTSTESSTEPVTTSAQGNDPEEVVTCPTVCPSPTNHSLIYDLNPDSAGYPAGDIGNEIVNSGPLQDCLARQVLRPNDPPTILVEPFELTDNVTCPFDQLRLWQYQSQTINAMCWVLQYFQENILYRICNTRFCKNCTDSPATKTKTRGYGKRNQGVAQRDNRKQKFCITEYRTVSLWAYCPTLPAGTRIIRDRIIVPFACSCQTSMLTMICISIDKLLFLGTPFLHRRVVTGEKTLVVIILSWIVSAFYDNQQTAANRRQKRDTGVWYCKRKYCCPDAQPADATQDLGTDPTNYPIGLISDFMVIARQPAGSERLMFENLLPQVVMPEQTPVFFDARLSERDCPSEQEQLWSYRSPFLNINCWVIQNLQPPIMVNLNCG